MALGERQVRDRLGAIDETGEIDRGILARLAKDSFGLARNVPGKGESRRVGGADVADLRPDISSLSDLHGAQVCRGSAVDGQHQVGNADFGVALRRFHLNQEVVEGLVWIGDRRLKVIELAGNRRTSGGHRETRRRRNVGQREGVVLGRVSPCRIGDLPVPRKTQVAGTDIDFAPRGGIFEIAQPRSPVQVDEVRVSRIAAGERDRGAGLHRFRSAPGFERRGAPQRGDGEKGDDALQWQCPGPPLHTFYGGWPLTRAHPVPSRCTREVREVSRNWESRARSPEELPPQYRVPPRHAVALLRHELVSPGVPGFHHREVTAIGGGDRVDLQPLGHGDDGGVDEPDGRISPHHLNAAGQILLP